MNKYKVTLVRVEHTTYYIDLLASNPEDAKELATEKWKEGDFDFEIGDKTHDKTTVSKVNLLVY